MKVGIFFNERQAGKECALRLAETFRKSGASAALFTQAEQIGGIDRLVVLGGDGTVLHGAQRACELGIPLVGVNFGTLGFLTEFDRDEIGRTVPLVLDENCPILRRSMLEVGFRGKKTRCLNELSLMRTVAPEREEGVVRISVEIDGHPAGEFRADGLILSTPTGSTAYSRSAGGSIIAPDCDAFLLTPVCPLSLKSRPIVCSDRSLLRFAFPETDEVVLHGDGNYIGAAERGDEVTARKADVSAEFLTSGSNDFFRRLTEKIG